MTSRGGSGRPRSSRCRWSRSPLVRPAALQGRRLLPGDGSSFSELGLPFHPLPRAGRQGEGRGQKTRPGAADRVLGELRQRAPGLVASLSPAMLPGVYRSLSRVPCLTGGITRVCSLVFFFFHGLECFLPELNLLTRCFCIFVNVKHFETLLGSHFLRNGERCLRAPSRPPRHVSSFEKVWVGAEG